MEFCLIILTLIIIILIEIVKRSSQHKFILGGQKECIKVDRIVGPLGLFIYNKIFNNTQLWLFGEDHVEYTEDTCKKGATKNTIIMNIYTIFRKLMQDKNTYILVERSNINPHNHRIEYADSPLTHHLTLESDLIKLHIKAFREDNPRVIYNDDIRDRYFYWTWKWILFRGNAEEKTLQVNRIYKNILITKLKKYPTMDKFLEYVRETVREDPEYKKLYKKTPRFLTTKIEEFLTHQCKKYITKCNNEYSKYAKCILDIIDIPDKLSMEKKIKLWSIMDDFNETIMKAVHTVTDMFTVMTIYQLKNKRVMCYNGGSHSLLLRRFFKYACDIDPSTSYDSTWNIPRKERKKKGIDVKCLIVDDMNIPLKYTK